ncbi:MAG: hypothetical protein JEZ09_11215 [Salinivirgaceae bacterium]|nr:hypothetical protein [Salinivirgaceae bacterium]
MKNRYICPKCRNNINIENNIVLIAKNEFDQKGIIMLQTKFGDYSTKFSSDFTIIEGDKVKFLCPVCHANLSNLKNDCLASFNIIDQSKKESLLVFSQIYGEKCTYVIEDKVVKKSFGDDLGKYIDSDWILLI